MCIMLGRRHAELVLGSHEVLLVPDRMLKQVQHDTRYTKRQPPHGFSSSQQLNP